MHLILKIYDTSGKNIVKTCESGTYDLMFGTVMKLMELLRIEDMKDQIEMLRTISGAWSEIKDVLSEVFPGVSEEEWKCVKVRELLPVIIDIAKFAVTDALSIPTEKN